MVKTPTKTKRTAKRSSPLKVTAKGVIITLNAAQKRRAQTCLRKTGKITLGFREIESTQLKDLVNMSVIVN